ncbi:MAG: hypothetical protein GF409_04175 [Candidatus Omnitrophica bacterium]|nr:hypothetical protein [Candidatus Omnitrophota bacterium]
MLYLYDMKSGRRLLFQFLVITLIYLVFALPKMDQPVTDDEIYEINNVRLIIAGEKPVEFIPSIYNWALVPFVRGFNERVLSVRMLGLLCAFASLGLLLVLARGVFGEHDPRVMAAGVFLATSPLFVQGSLLVHVDSTLLVTAVLLWMVCLTEFLEGGTFIRRLLLLASLTFTLLCKFSTPLLILPFTLGFVFLKRRKLFFNYFLICVLSVFSFCALWWLLCQLNTLSFGAPFIGLLERGRMYLSAAGLKTILNNMVIFCAWASPYLVIGSFLMVLSLIRDHPLIRDKLLLVGITACSILLYLAVSPINHGFPKYILPGIPLIGLFLSGNYLRGIGRERSKYLALLLGCAAYLIMMQYDPVYLIRFKLRDILAYGGGTGILYGQLFWQSLVYLLPLLLFFFLRRRIRVPLGAALVILIISFNVSLASKQALARYQTNYSYGQEGAEELEAFLDKNVRERDKIIATKEVLYLLGRTDSFYSVSFWRNPEDFLDALKRSRFLVVSTPSHSMYFFRNVLNAPEVRDYLDKNYRVKRMGTFIIYQRR